MLSRRQFLQSGLAVLATASLGNRLALASDSAPAPLILSAVDDANGQHFITGMDLTGQRRFLLPVGDRCHGGCSRPGVGEAVLFARRPGRHFYVIDTTLGAQIHQAEAGDGYHFYGHGVFSHDGRYLYVTVNHYVSGEGAIRVYDAQDGYRTVDDYPVDGIGPHELRLHPDGETLIIALGGIKTHPDYDRIKLNLDTMQPALLLMDRRSGRIQSRYTPSHHQLSCRHLDVSPDGIVIAGYQYQGPEWEAPPLIARLDTRTHQFTEIGLPEDVQASLRNYTASIAASPAGRFTAITAPRGNQVVIVDHRAGTYVRRYSVADVAGALPAGRGFVVSSGDGSVHRIAPERDAVKRLAQLDIHWDNHLTLSG